MYKQKPKRISQS